MQRSADNACLGEAKAAMNGAFSELSIDGEISSGYTASACASVTPGITKGAKTLSDQTFTAKARGGSGGKVTCKADSATCTLASATTTAPAGGGDNSGGGDN